jgi:predicted Fe-Mo cluster-binding NifX family protein
VIEMRIAISSTGEALDSEVDPRFGRSEYFILVELETMQVETIRNPNLQSSTGAGIGTAQLICDKGVGVVLTGRIGPKADQALSAAGVRMVTGVSGKVRDAVEQYKAGKFSSGADLRAGSQARGAAGMGRGMGQGGGGGRGMGQGQRCGGGQGMGMGSGGGRGRALRSRDASLWTDKGSEPAGQDELALLKRQAASLADELTRIRQRIEQIEKK